MQVRTGDPQTLSATVQTCRPESAQPTFHLYTHTHTYICGVDDPGIQSQWGRDFPHQSRPDLGPTQLPIQWVPGLSRGLSGRGEALTTHAHLAMRLKKE